MAKAPSPAPKTADLVDLGFKVDKSFRHDFRLVARLMDLSHRELFEQSFALFVETNGLRKQLATITKASR